MVRVLASVGRLLGLLRRPLPADVAALCPNLVREIDTGVGRAP